MLGNVPCPSCNGGKVFACVVGEEDLPRLRAWTPDMGCGWCNNTGYCRPAAAAYGFSVESVAKFANFLADCGGFEI